MYLLGDIGGSKLRFALIKNLNKIDKIEILETPKKYNNFLNLIKKFKNEKIKLACFGFAGNFDHKKEKLIFAPNLKDYENKNLKKDLEKILECKAILENDALLAGLGEGKFGAGKKFDIFGYITLGSGIGGAKIVKNRPDENVFGFEPGHSFLLVQSKTYNVLPFEIEELIGGKNIEKIYGKKPEEIKNKKFWDDYQKILAHFLVNVSLFWSVSAIIIGGGISKSLDFKKLDYYFRKFHPLKLKIKILKSKLQEKSALYGGIVKIMLHLNFNTGRGYN
jgi:predicted NBD/HSP70 family sugar kinase